jgi:hypothetical protein
MNNRKTINILILFVFIVSLLLGNGQVNAQKGDPPPPEPDKVKITQKDRQDAVALSLQHGALNPLMLDNQITVSSRASQAQQLVAGAALINGAPHYFSHPNYANSPLPTVQGAVIEVGSPLQDRAWASDTPVAVGELAPVLVVMGDVLPDGMIQSFQTWNQATGGNSPFPSAGNVFHAYVLRPTGVADEYSVVFDSGQLTVPALTNPSISEVATFGVANLAVQSGDRLAFYGQGVPVDIVAGGVDQLVFPSPTAPLQDSAITLNSAEYPIYPQERTYSFGAQMIDMSGQNTIVVGGIRKFVDGLPGLGSANANNLGQYVSVAVPDQVTYSGSDYYEIALVEFQEQMHSDLPPTTHRGYVQLSTTVVPGAQVPLLDIYGDPISMPDGSSAIGVDAPHYLGATIVAQKDRPVRIKFYNLLPTGHFDSATGRRNGDLFLPVDTSVMGSGVGPISDRALNFVDPQNPKCGDLDKPYDCYTENRATLHLHGVSLLGSAMARRISGSLLLARTLPIRRASAWKTFLIWPVVTCPLMVV